MRVQPERVRDRNGVPGLAWHWQLELLAQRLGANPPLRLNPTQFKPRHP